MTDSRNRESFPDHFQRESLELVNRLLPLSSSGFYLVGADMRHRGVVMRDLSPLVDRDYSENYRHLDPARFAGEQTLDAVLDEQVSEPDLLRSQYYQEFMHPLGQRQHHVGRSLG